MIEVHSNQSGEEPDEVMARLLAVEHDEATEVVIHVNKLKEGWDVTNLYTIVPLRASASEILTEQTIGRGLRLPFGRRTGVEAVDRLCIIAHDRFQEIVDRANDADSIIKKTVYIGPAEDAEVPDRQPQLLSTGSLAEILSTGRQPELDGKVIEAVGGEAKGTVAAPGEEEARLATLALRAIGEEATRLPSSRALEEAVVQERLLAKVKRLAEETVLAQASLPGMEVMRPTPVGAAARPRSCGAGRTSGRRPSPCRRHREFSLRLQPETPLPGTADLRVFRHGCQHQPEQVQGNQGDAGHVVHQLQMDAAVPRGR